MTIGSFESDTAVLSELGKRLADYRIRIPLTQTELAQKTGLSVHTITNIEAGRSVQMVNLIRVLRALGLQQNMDILVPKVMDHPAELHKLGRNRVRATSPIYRKKPEGRFKWGDEK